MTQSTEVNISVVWDRNYKRGVWDEVPYQCVCQYAAAVDVLADDVLETPPCDLEAPEPYLLSHPHA